MIEFYNESSPKFFFFLQFKNIYLNDHEILNKVKYRYKDLNVVPEFCKILRLAKDFKNRKKNFKSVIKSFININAILNKLRPF